jgi:hypothetical protein
VVGWGVGVAEQHPDPVLSVGLAVAVSDGVAEDVSGGVDDHHVVGVWVGVADHVAVGDGE